MNASNEDHQFKNIRPESKAEEQEIKKIIREVAEEKPKPEEWKKVENK